MDKKQVLAIIGLVFLLGFSSGWLVDRYLQPEKQPEMVIKTADTTEKPKGENTKPGLEEARPIWVHVVGEVSKPGVYQLPSGSRVFQAVELAVAANKADLGQLNMAGMLADGERIVVPKKGEKLGPDTPVTTKASANTGSSGLVNINTASAEELDSRLPGIGPSLAQRIIDYRAGHQFNRKEDLKEVSGIGDKRYESIQDLITVGP